MSLCHSSSTFRNTTEHNMTTNASDQTVQVLEDNQFDEDKTGNKIFRLESYKKFVCQYLLNEGIFLITELLI